MPWAQQVLTVEELQMNSESLSVKNISESQGGSIVASLKMERGPSNFGAELYGWRTTPRPYTLVACEQRNLWPEPIRHIFDFGSAVSYGQYLIGKREIRIWRRSLI